MTDERAMATLLGMYCMMMNKENYRPTGMSKIYVTQLYLHGLRKHFRIIPWETMVGSVCEAHWLVETT